MVEVALSTPVFRSGVHSIKHQLERATSERRDPSKAVTSCGLGVNDIKLTKVLIPKGFDSQVLHGMVASKGYDSVYARDTEVEVLAPDGSNPTFAGVIYHRSQDDKYVALIASGDNGNRQLELYDCELIASVCNGKKQFKKTISYSPSKDSILPSEDPSELEIALQKHLNPKPVSTEATTKNIKVRLITGH